MESTIEIVAEPHPLMLFARWIVRVSIDIDGHLARFRWGSHVFTVPPGNHVVTVGVGSAFSSKAILEVHTVENERTRLVYTPRFIKHLRGKLVVDRLPAARVVK